MFILASAGASLGISIDGCKMPSKPWDTSINGCKLPYNPYFQEKSMGEMRKFSKLMGAIAPIDPP